MRSFIYRAGWKLGPDFQTVTMEDSKIETLKQNVEKYGHIEVSSKFIFDVLQENKELLAHNPLDILMPDFERDIQRLSNYLRIRIIKIDNSSFAVIKKS